MAATKKLDQFTVVTVDDSFEKIVELDQAKKSIRFSAKPGEFKELTTGEVKQLSEMTKFAYNVARDEWRDLADAERAEEEHLLELIRVGETMGRATQRLNIDGQQKGMVYRWIRPDEQRDYLAPNRGWKIVKDGPERTLQNQTGRGPHVIGTKGSEELILVKRSEAAHRAEKEARKEKKRAARVQLDDKYREQIDRRGLKSFGGEESDRGDDEGREWSDLVSEKAE